LFRRLGCLKAVCSIYPCWVSTLQRERESIGRERQREGGREGDRREKKRGKEKRREGK
jgi:hypothetical protein